MPRNYDTCKNCALKHPECFKSCFSYMIFDIINQGTPSNRAFPNIPSLKPVHSFKFPFKFAFVRKED